MSQTQLALGILGISLLYALVIGVAYLWRRRTSLKPVLAFATVNNQRKSRNMFTALTNTSPNESAYDTREVSVIQGPPKWRKRFIVPLVVLVVVVAFGVGLVLGNAYGKNHVVKVQLNHTGWFMTNLIVDGAPPPDTLQRVFLFWNNASNPQDFNVGWYLVDIMPHAKKPILATFNVDAYDDGQGKIYLTAHTPGGAITIDATLDGDATLNDQTLTMHIRPNAYLYPSVPTAFYTLTFLQASTETFNHLVNGGVQ